MATRSVGMQRTVSKPALVLAGPSGVGKGTIVKELGNLMGDMLGFSVSHTTRAKRPREQEGVAYHFTTREAMLQQIANGEFIEHAEVHGNLYGTSVAAVEQVMQQGRVCVLDIDVQGAESVRKLGMNALLAFIEPPSLNELERRLRCRGTESEDDIQRRLQNAHSEMERSRQPGVFDLQIVNESAKQCAHEIYDALQPRIQAAEQEQQQQQ